MSPYLTRPVRTYVEAAAAVVAASTIPGVRLTGERLYLLIIIEDELKRRAFRFRTQSRASR
jgi:hypothetical protein